MKLSLNWIKEYVEIPKDFDIKKLAYDLTMATVEVEAATNLAAAFENMVVAVVKKVEKHPNADLLVLCEADLSNGEMREIVCGGSNLSVGMKVAVARPGAMVRWHGEGDLIPIGKAKVRGVESYGMICASSEIGLFDLFPYVDENEIMDLSDFAKAEAGENLADALGLNDVILEIDNKSLTNRPDLWGHYGIAREISAIYGFELKELKPFTMPVTEKLNVEIEDTNRCPRYIGVKLENTPLTATPYEIKSKLWRVGLKPANNAAVDITNYVLLATGQPTHAFDADRINGHITIRHARSGEKLLLLSGKEIALCEQDLVIADAKGPVALAGVMGGESDSVLPSTKNIILEIANFAPNGVRRTASRYDLRTEASTRYEKGIDSERCDMALALSMNMFSVIYPNLSIKAYEDAYPNVQKCVEIDVSLSWMVTRLGKDPGKDFIKNKLGLMGFDVTYDGDNMRVKAPTWRSTGDISIADDIVEEVARLYGFENFEPMPIVTAFDKSINQLNVDLDRKIKEFMAFRCGMREIFTYPWVQDEYIEALVLPIDEMLSLAAPISQNERYIRSSLLPNLCKAVSDNLRYFDEFAIFESAQVFFKKDFEATYDEKEMLPLQRKNIAGAFAGSAENIGQIFRKAKGMIEALPQHVHCESLSFVKQEKPLWSDDVLWLNIAKEGGIIGNLALLSKKASLKCKIKNSAVLLFEIDVDAIAPLSSRANSFKQLSEYPMTDYDVSLLFDLSVTWDEIKAAILSNKNAGELLRHVDFVDEYRGKQVPEDKKSVTIRLTIGSLTKTLTSEEIEKCANAIMKRLEKTLSAQQRS